MFSINHTTCTYSSGTKGQSSETHGETANLKFPDSSSVPTLQASPSKDGSLRPAVYPALCTTPIPYLLLSAGSFPHLVLSIYPNPSLEDHFSSAGLCQLFQLLLSPSSEPVSSDDYHYGLFILEHIDSPHTTATRQGSTRNRLPKTNDGVDSKLTAKKHVYSGNTELNQRQLREQVSTLCEPTQNPGYYRHDFSRIGHRLVNSENMV